MIANWKMMLLMIATLEEQAPKAKVHTLVKGRSATTLKMTHGF